MDGLKQKASSPQDWQRSYHQLDVRHRRLLKRYDQTMRERHSYKQQAYHLEAELRTLRPEVSQAGRKIERLQQRVEKLESQNDALRKQLAGVKDQAASPCHSSSPEQRPLR